MSDVHVVQVLHGQADLPHQPGRLLLREPVLWSSVVGWSQV